MAAHRRFTRSGLHREGNQHSNMQTQQNFSADDDDFAALFEKNTLETGDIREGSIVVGTVVDIIGDYAVVDAGRKAEGPGPPPESAEGGAGVGAGAAPAGGWRAEGQVRLGEFAEEDGSVNVHVGDKIEVLLEAT